MAHCYYCRGLVLIVILPILISYRHVSADSPVDSWLEWTIDSLISRLPGLIDEAVEVIQKDIKLKNAKKTSQGASIVWGAFSELTADWILNNRAVTNLDAKYLYKLGSVTKKTGIGKGGKLLIGLPSSDLKCGGSQFQELVDNFGIPDLDYSSHFAEAAVTEFGFRVQYTLNCVLKKSNKYKEASEVAWSIEELLSALSLRAGRNKEPDSVIEFHNNLWKRKARRSGSKAKGADRRGLVCVLSNRVGDGQVCQRTN